MTCGFRNCQSRACGSTIRPDGHELAFCVAHEAIARHLPPLRSATCCTSEGCGRPQGSRSPLCKSCRPRYSAWGLDGYPVPQEAPMTEPTPEAQEAQTSPPAAPQDAAGEGAIPSAACTAIDGRILDRATAPGTDGESDGEPSAADVDDAYSGQWGQYANLDGLAALAARGQQPTAPGPTLAEVQAQLERERELNSHLRTMYQEAVAARRAEEGLRIHAETDLIGERQRAEAAEEQLSAIARILGPDDPPAVDADGDPVPLPSRVRMALAAREELADAAYERELRKSLHAVEAELYAVDRALQHLGAYGNGPTIDQLLKVLTNEDRRNILELQAAEARLDLAHLKASRLNPPPPEKLAEYAAKVAEVEAKIAALDAGEVQK